MSYVIAAAEMMTSAASDLAAIGSNVSAAHMVAAAPTVAVLPAAAGKASTGIAQVFSGHAQAFQGLAGKAAAFHDQFVATLKTSVGAYTGAEAAATVSLKPAAGLPGLPALPDFSGLWNNFWNSFLDSGFFSAALGLLILGILGLFFGSLLFAILLATCCTPWRIRCRC